MKAIVFGANGYLGTSIVNELTKNGFDVTTTSRSSSETEFQTKNGFNDIISSGKKFNACIWAQGQNAQDTLSSAKNFEAVFDANVLYTIKSLTALIENGLLAPQARLVVLSSVWLRSFWLIFRFYRSTIFSLALCWSSICWLWNFSRAVSIGVWNSFFNARDFK